MGCTLLKALFVTMVLVVVLSLFSKDVLYLQVFLAIMSKESLTTPILQKAFIDNKMFSYNGSLV